MTRFILASQSPRRWELLSLCGYPFQVMAANVDETIIDIAEPSENTIKTAQLKAKAVANNSFVIDGDRVIIIAADTVVVLDKQMLGKPSGAAEAHSMLLALRGRDHLVYTGLALLDLGTGKEVTAVHAARVHMRSYTDQEINRYVNSGDPLDKAGAYAIQHPRFRPVASLDGCYLGVMGLSVCQLLDQLRRTLEVPILADMTTLYKAHHHYPCPLLAELGPQA
jgi:septum formation protein